MFFGTNDAAAAGGQHVSLDRFVPNVKYIVEALVSREIKTIVVGPATHDPHPWEASRMDQVAAGIRRSNDVNEKYSKALESLCTSLNVPFLNLYTPFLHSKENPLCDGVHFNGTGYKIFYDGLMKLIETNFPEYHPDSLPQSLLPWREASLDGLSGCFQ